MNADIAYLYSELSITYQGSDQPEKAINCLKQQIQILKHLRQDQTFDYMASLNLLGEIQKDLGLSTEAIETFLTVVKLQEKVLAKDEILEAIPTLKLLAEELTKVGKSSEGAQYARQALEI